MIRKDMSGNLSYEKQVMEMLESSFREEWMDECYWKQILDEYFKATGQSVSLLSNAIDEGVKNGHSVESQISIIKCLFRKKG